MSSLLTNILIEFKAREIVFLPGENLTEFLNSVKIVSESDTLISDFIRIVCFQDWFIVQEKSPKNEILLRKFPDHESAAVFIDGRLKIYEKMWDGCGCKINYYS